DAADWIDSGLPSYDVGVPTGHTHKSLGSALEVALDSLLDAVQDASDRGLGPGGAPIVPFEGMTDAQLHAVDDVREAPLAGAPTPQLVLGAITASDGSNVVVTVTPAALIEG